MILKIFYALVASLLVLNHAQAGVSGKIMDTSGEPIAGADVIIHAFEIDSGPLIERTSSDDEGNYDHSFEPWRKIETYNVGAYAEGYALGYATQKADKEGPIDVKLSTGASIEGLVFGRDSTGLADAKIRVDYIEYKQDGKTVEIDKRFLLSALDTSTGENAAFKIDHIPLTDGPGSLRVYITVEAKDHATSSLVLVEDDIGYEKEVLMDPACKLVGRVWVKDGKPEHIAGKDIAAMVVHGKDVSFHLAKIDEKGRFVMEDLPAGVASVFYGELEIARDGTLLHPNDIPKYTFPARENIVMNPVEDRSLDISITPGVLVRGSVIDKTTGGPAAHAKIHVTHAGIPAKAEGIIVRADARGSFAFRAPTGIVKKKIIALHDNGTYTPYEGTTIETEVYEGRKLPLIMMEVEK